VSGDTKPHDLARPGHFSLDCKTRGVLERTGHTSNIDFCPFAGLNRLELLLKYE
jgi:3,4-dihydroxy-2-butanone 4-phosphate synthase